MSNRIVVTMLAIALAGGLPAGAAEKNFRWDVGVNGGYVSNLFFREGGEVSSWGGDVGLGLGFNALTPRNEFDVWYRANYYYYDVREDEEGARSSPDHFGHGLGLELTQRWTPRWTFRTSARASHTQEQESFLLRPEDRFTVVQRVRRTTADATLEWTAQASQRTDVRFGYSNAISRYGDPVIALESPLADDTVHRGFVGVSFATSAVGRLGVTYDYSRQESERDEFTDADGTLFGAFEDRSETHHLATNYSWQFSPTSRAQIGAGVFRNEPRDGDGDRGERTSWTLQGSVARQLSPRVDMSLGASREVATFGGLGGTAVGESAFTRFGFLTSRNTNLDTTLHFTRREGVQESDRSVRTGVGNATFRHRLARWGGYSVSYSLIDQQVSGARPADASDDFFFTNDRDLRYDLIRFGLFFSPPTPDRKTAGRLSGRRGTGIEG